MDECKGRPKSSRPRGRQAWVRSRVAALLSLLWVGCAAAAPDPSLKIELDKINPNQVGTGPYSYFVPPYSYYYFHHMDQLGFRLDWVRRSGPVYPLREAPRTRTPLAATYRYAGKTYTLEDYFQRNGVLGFLVLKNDRIVAERYFHGADASSRFLSNSVAKSMTSTLIGVALEEGKIGSLTDPLTKYVPALKGSGYERVTLQQGLEMATGIDATENPLDPKSSIHKFNAMVISGKPSFLDYLKALKAKPDVTPGKVFDYLSINTEALGLALEKATGTPLNVYMQEKLWSKIGAQSDGFLYRARPQPDQCAFGCFSATARDYARFGLMVLHGGALGGKRVVSASWLKLATTPKPVTMPPDSQGYRYGYQWWIPAGTDGAYEALGIFGQLIYINPAKHVVVVQNAAWKQPDNEAQWDEAAAAIDAIVAKLGH